jgi:uncharacterized RDD family membrane protein YckC
MPTPRSGRTGTRFTIGMSTNDSFSWGAESLTRRERRRRARGDATRRSSLLGARAAAVIVDGFILVVPVFALAYLLSLAFPHRGFFFVSTSSSDYRGSTSAAFGLQIGLSGSLVISALSLSYFFMFEATRGQTIGKRLQGLRVQSAHGSRAGLTAVAARTLLRAIDGLVFYLLGALIAILTGSRRRRLGDWIGGTVVVRDEGAIDDGRSPPRWRLLAVPLAWTAAVFVAIFALGIGTVAGHDEQAIALVRSYLVARRDGNARLACSMLSPEQQRELVAIQTRDYASAKASRCPSLILGEEPRSHLLNPALSRFAAGPVIAHYNAAGLAVIESRSAPGLQLVAIFNDGRPLLDMRGAEKLGFVKGCAEPGSLTASQCGCVFTTWRAAGLLEQALAGRRTASMEASERTCLPAGLVTLS